MEWFLTSTGLAPGISISIQIEDESTLSAILPILPIPAMLLQLVGLEEHKKKVRSSEFQ